MADWTRSGVTATWSNGKKAWSALSSTWATVNAGYVYSITFTEGCSIRDAVSKAKSVTVKEKASLATTYTDYRQFVLRVLEAVRVADRGNRQFYITQGDSFGIVDKVNRDIQLCENELLSLLDDIAYAKYISRHFLEDIGFEDSVLKHSLKELVENFGVEDSSTKEITLTKETAIGVDTEFSKDADRHFFEQAAVVDSVLKHSLKELVENFGVEDSSTKEITLTKETALSIESLFTDVRIVVRHFMERIATEESVLKDILKELAEEFSVEDNATKKVDLTKKSTISIDTEFTKDADRQFLEQIAVDELTLKDILKELTENFGVEDNATKEITLNKETAINIDTEFTDERIVVRQFMTALGISDSLAKQLAKVSNEQVNVLGDYLRNSNAVISDILISAGEINRDVPAGYSDWLPFVSGDYTYKEALVRSVLSASSPDNKSVLSAFCIKVDLPDLQDHGVVDVGAGEVRVLFNLDFYRVPEVTVTMVSGSGESSIPNITEVTEKYFKLKLLNTAGEVVSGKASWTAVGC